MKEITTILLLLFYASIMGQTIKPITSPSQLTTAYSLTLNPGDIIELADGTYPSSATMKFNGVGTEAMPITFRPQNPGGVKFTGGQTLKIGGEYCIVDGFHWQGGNGASNFIEFRDGTNLGNNSTIQNCVIDGLQSTSAPGTSTKHNWIVMYGTYNTVINCSILNKTSSGNMILVELAYNASPDGSGTPNTRCNEVGHKIINNYFYNYPKVDPALTNSGDSETIRIGTSEYQNVNSNSIVSNNYFVQADGENEIITNKSKGNTYTNNTFRRCRGSLVLRHGSHTTVDGNYFLGENVEGTGGIRIVDSYQTITNNYIQDCINVASQAQWNNGITFLGGNDSSAVICSSTSMTNGYQKVTNLNLNNNTIVNTNAPLYYNVAQGSTDPLGNVNNNLIYFASGNANITPVINSDYTGLGTALSYAGNVYKGTTLGATNPNFTEETGITATAAGEIFTFSGAPGKGADMGAYTPITDNMVGYEIGACFVNNLGANITNGTCAIVIPESLTVGSLPTLTYVAASYDVPVTANVGWSAVSNDAWITTINPATGTGDATVSVTVTENTGTESRSGSVTFTQVGGDGDDSTKTLNITQDAPPPPDPRDGLNLINKLASDVDVAYVSNEEVTSTKNNIAIHSLDKNFGTQWASNGNLDPGGSGHSIIIYNLKGAFDLDLVDIATTNGKTYFLEIWVSSSGTANEDFTNAFPSSGDLISNTDASFKAFVLPTQAIGTKYVKLIGKGQASSTFTTIHEIEFYGDASTLSTNNILKNDIKLFPNPVSNGILYLSKLQSDSLDKLTIYDVSGIAILTKNLNASSNKEAIDVSSISEGLYFVELLKGSSKSVNKIIISKK